jgi:hypothetical protein
MKLFFFFILFSTLNVMADSITFECKNNNVEVLAWLDVTSGGIISITYLDNSNEKDILFIPKDFKTSVVNGKSSIKTSAINRSHCSITKSKQCGIVFNFALNSSGDGEALLSLFTFKNIFSMKDYIFQDIKLLCNSSN